MSLANRDGEKEKKRKRTIKVEAPSAGGGGDSKRIKAVDVGLKDSKSAFFAEEEEVDTRDAKKDVEQFQNTCDDIIQTISDIKGLKSMADKETASKEIAEQRVQATLQFVVLRKLNRLSHIRCKKVRDATNEAKQRIDSYHLQLQNLLYEVHHLEKEINKCLEFRSKDEEIDLVPVDEFYKGAPEDIAKSDVTTKDEHSLRLARLDWELHQRKQLATKLKEVQQNKEVVAKEIDTKQEYLENLQPKLNTILQATKPVQEYLDMPFDEIREQHQTAHFLPHPLYVLYMQTSAYRQACDKHLTVTITGDVDAARSLDMSTPDLDEDSDSDQEEQDKQSSKRRRKTTDVRVTERKDKVLRRHPLSVVVELLCKDGSSLRLSFYYMIVLHVITVDTKVKPSSDAVTSSISGGDMLSAVSILSELYPGDHGTTTPNPANQYELTRLGLREFGNYISEVGRPYMWAQWLGGLQFLGDVSPNTPQSSVSSGHMRQTIKQLRRRMKSRLSLLKQLSSLERGSVPVSGEYQKLFPTKIISHLSSWKRLTYEDFVDVAYTKPVVEAGLAKPCDLYFCATVDRGSAKLTAQIVLTPDYPGVVPLFVVSVKWHTERNACTDHHLQELEEELNVYYGELINERYCDQILSNQIQRLLMCFDVYLETELSNTSQEGPIEISREKIYPRTARGPHRTKPYRFCPDVGIFTHR